MKFFCIEPEVGGGLGPQTVMDTTQHPPAVSRLHYVIDGWLGDAILESFPCFIVTAALQKDILSKGFTGAEFDHVLVTASDEFSALQPDVRLPEWKWLKVSGAVSVNDFGRSPDHRLVVSVRVLDVLRSHRLDHCDVEEYV